MKCAASDKLYTLDNPDDICPVCGAHDVLVETCIENEYAVREHARVLKKLTRAEKKARGR